MTDSPLASDVIPLAPAVLPVRPEISVLAPVFDEAATVGELVVRVAAAFESIHVSYELILVDDGSRDASWKAIKEAVASDARVVGLRHRGNFGKAAALATALSRAGGQTIVTIDSDLQDDPAEIPALLAALDGGLDLVSGWKRDRKDPLSKRLPSKLFNATTRRVSGVNLKDFNCGLKAARAEVYHDIPLYGELHRFIPVLAAGLGYDVGEIPVQHHPRRHGRSKYGLERMVRGLLDLFTVVSLTRYDRRPGHLFGSLGLLLGGLGSVILAYLAAVWVFTDHSIGDRPLLLAGVMAVLFGAQLLSLGILAELILNRTRRLEQVDLVVESASTVADGSG